MRIQTVSYRRLRNLGNYENDSVEATAAVERGETPEQALAKLGAWVHERLGFSPDELERLERHARALKDEIALLEDKAGYLRANWEATRASLAARGVDVDDLVVDALLPF